MTDTKMDAPRGTTNITLEGDRTVLLARTFRASPRVVFDAWTKADLVKRWWAPVQLGVKMVSCEADVRVGGKYRYVLQPRDNPEIAFSGEYREISPHSRLVYTQVFEPMADAGEMEITVTFEEDGAHTRVLSREVYPSPEARQGSISSGMEVGAREIMDRLDELVVELDA